MVENSWEHPNVFVFQSDCYEHQDHLIVKAGLILTDAFLKSWNEEDAAANAPTVVKKVLQRPREDLQRLEGRGQGHLRSVEVAARFC